MNNYYKPMYFCFLLIFSLVSCSNNGWKYICNTPYLHNANDIWFQKNIGLFVGYYSSIDNQLVKNLNKRWALREAIVLRIDLNGDRVWNKVFSGKGEILKITTSPRNMIYALGREYGEGGDQKAYLLRSKDLGQNWERIPHLPGVIDGIEFSKAKVFFAWSKNKVWVSNDNLLTWALITEDINIEPNEVQPVVDNDGVLWLLNGNRRIVGLKDNGERFVEIPNTHLKIDAFATASTGQLLLIGRAGRKYRDKVVILRRESSQKYETMSELPFFLPRSFWTQEDYINIWGSDMTGSRPKRVLYSSIDSGMTWKHESPKDTYANGPIYFENKDIIWNVATEDRLQRRKK